MLTVASRLASRGIGGVWSSEIARARESAGILGEVLGVPLRTDDRLNEMLLGPWEGLTEDEVAERHPETFALWLARPARVALPGRETLAHVRERISAAVREAAGLPHPLVLVTHVAPIRVAALAFLGLPLGHYKRVDVGNASAILIEPGFGRVCRLDESGSLAEEFKQPGDAPAWAPADSVIQVT